jgi:tetratricopeptide (TPR) repeat protein
VDRAAVLGAAGRWREEAAALTRALAQGERDSTVLPRRARAYVRLGGGERAVADVDALVERHPKEAAGWEARAEVLARLGQYDRAAADYARALALGEDGALPPGTAYRLALVRLAAGDAAGYREVCAAVLRRAAQSDELEAGYALVLVLAPDAPGVRENLRRAERMQAELGQAKAVPLPLPTWGWTEGEGPFLVGALAYRAGPDHDRDAVRLLTEAVAAAKDKRHPSAALFLALAHHRLGDDREARRWLYRAEEWLAADPGPWDRELEERLLFREAAAALGETKP